jgi:transcriptional regulator with XRE-family HTH domain
VNRLSTANFSKNMKLQMQKQGIGFIELERRTGIGRGGLSEYANNKHKMSLEYALAISRALGKTVDEMLVVPDERV